MQCLPPSYRHRHTPGEGWVVRRALSFEDSCCLRANLWIALTLSFCICKIGVSQSIPTLLGDARVTGDHAGEIPLTGSALWTRGVGGVLFYTDTLGSHQSGYPRSSGFISSFATVIKNRLCKRNAVGIGCLTSVECWGFLLAVDLCVDWPVLLET